MGTRTHPSRQAQSSGLVLLAVGAAVYQRQLQAWYMHIPPLPNTQRQQQSQQLTRWSAGDGAHPAVAARPHT